MALFLQIMGILFLIMLLVIGGGLLWLRLKVKSIVADFEGLSAAVDGAMMPARVELVPDNGEYWTHREEAEQQAAAFAAMGFEDGGQWMATPIPGLYLQGFAKPDEQALAVVYDHPMAGVFADVVTRFEPNGELTVTSAPRGAAVDMPPGHEKISLPEATPQALMEQFRQAAAGRARRPASAADFKTEFEAAYAREMDWRNLRGGPTEDEIRRIAAESGEVVDDITLAEMRAAYQRRAAEGLSEAALELYQAQATFSGAEWSSLAGRLVAVHDRLTAGMLADLLRCWLHDDGEDEDEDDEDDDERAAATYLRQRLGGLADEDLPPRRKFAQFNETLDEGRRFRLLGTVREPLESDIYAAP